MRDLGDVDVVEIQCTPTGFGAEIADPESGEPIGHQDTFRSCIDVIDTQFRNEFRASFPRSVRQL